MPSPVKIISVFAYAIVLAFLLLMASGCTKEELVAPKTVPQAVQSMEAPTTGTGTVIPGASGTDKSPITDDGDDMGDNERTTTSGS